MNSLSLDYRLSEFATKQDEDAYGAWLHAKVAEARRSPTVSHEEAMAHFAAKRAERLKKLQNATAD